MTLRKRSLAFKGLVQKHLLFIIYKLPIEMNSTRNDQPYNEEKQIHNSFTLWQQYLQCINMITCVDPSSIQQNLPDIKQQHKRATNATSQGLQYQAEIKNKHRKETTIRKMLIYVVRPILGLHPPKFCVFFIKHSCQENVYNKHHHRWAILLIFSRFPPEHKSPFTLFSGFSPKQRKSHYIFWK